MPEKPDQKRDYRDTVFLPKTDFPMKAGLPQKEPGIQARWEEIGLYERIRESREGREKFILHDGPPYANGDIHVGHALNHVLKDMVVRTQTLLGKDAPYVPGWDCHGLPIEWKVEELYRKQKKSKNDVAPADFRAECRAYAQKWVDVQREQLKRLGIGGRWDKPYLTMRPEAEADIVRELHKFAETGQLYRGAKPVMWSPVEETALADAEVEYQDLTDSPQIDVAFEIVESRIPELVGAHAVIWTTTPWTIPVNQAIAYGPEVEYVLFTFQDRKLLIAKDRITETFLRLAFQSREGGFDEKAEVPDPNDWSKKGKLIKGSELVGTFALHPMAKKLRHSREGGNPGQVGDHSETLGPRFRGDDGKVDVQAVIADQAKRPFYERLRPFLPGDFVTTDSGTGLVHMSPDHGEDDFELCRANGIDPVFAVMGDGRYRDDWPWLGADDLDTEGKERRRSVINKPFNSPDGPICSDLREAGALLSASADYAHSYPHSWRSKAKVIYRCTPQWFIGMDEELAPPLPQAGSRRRGEATAGREVGDEDTSNQASPPLTPPASGRGTLRSIAMAEIGRVRFVPEKGRNRIGSMVSDRPDWLISRQRAWGVPIALFVHRESGELLVDTDVNARIQVAIRAGGIDAWDEGRAAEFLGPDRDPDDYEMVSDILDVWFDSGSTHAFVLESDEWPELRSPADLYLEGSDQHRGWFQSSLLESCGTRGRAPYETVLTHGFTMDSAGKKMSKSLGNTVDPLKIMETYGADIIRLWALSVDFTEDHRIGDEILKGVGDQYRRLRNTFRYLLGALGGFTEDERVSPADMPELERYVLALLGQLDGKLRRAVDDFDFNAYTRALVDFANEDLSAFFFDIRKDRLYCDAADGLKRRAYRTVLDTLFHALVRYAAPVLVFTSEEVWGTRFPEESSVHLREWPEVPAVEADIARWRDLREVRRLAFNGIERLRSEKKIRSSLEAEIVLEAMLQRHADALQHFDRATLAELFIVADVQISINVQDMAGVAIGCDVTVSENRKCGRCWRLLPEVAEDGDLCGRCESVVAELDAA